MTLLITNYRYLFSASYTVNTVLFQFVTLWLFKIAPNKFFQCLLILSFFLNFFQIDIPMTEYILNIYKDTCTSHKVLTASPCVLLWGRTYYKYVIDDDFSLCMLHEQGPPQKNFRCLTLRGQKNLQFNSKVVFFFLTKALKLKAILFINHLTDL